MKIMTYNVCWEALYGKKGGIDMTKCKINNVNKCFENIGKIINKRLIDDYDFIALQEINNTQWGKLSKNLSIENYIMIIKEISPAGVILLYKNNYKLIKKYTGNLGSSNDKRPYIISLFDNNIVVISLHMPHVNQESSFIKLQNKLIKLKDYCNKNTLFIFCGDFNNNNPLELSVFKNILKIFNTNLNSEPKSIKTCCRVPNYAKHKLSFDHIYISSNASYKTYNTLKKDEITKYMSDHLPIFAKITYNT